MFRDVRTIHVVYAQTWIVQPQVNLVSNVLSSTALFSKRRNVWKQKRLSHKSVLIVAFAQRLLRYNVSMLYTCLWVLWCLRHWCYHVFKDFPFHLHRIQLPMRPSIRPPVCPSVRPSVRPPFRPFDRSFLRPTVRPSVCQRSVRPTAHPTDCPSDRPSSHLSVRRPSARPPVRRTNRLSGKRSAPLGFQIPLARFDAITPTPNC